MAVLSPPLTERFIRHAPSFCHRSALCTGPRGMQADEIVKVIQASSACLLLVLGALGFGHHAKKRTARERERGPLDPPSCDS
jgi:hypothetical protein